MRKTLYLLAVAALMTCAACGAKDTEATTTSATEETTSNATDIAETTAAPIDTAGLMLDTTNQVVDNQGPEKQL